MTKFKRYFGQKTKNMTKKNQAWYSSPVYGNGIDAMGNQYPLRHECLPHKAVNMHKHRGHSINWLNELTAPWGHPI